MAKKLLLLLAVALVFFTLGRHTQQTPTLIAEPNPPALESKPQSKPPKAWQSHEPSSIARAFEQQKSDIPVQGAGQIIKELSDDDNGSRHQRILVELPDGLSILIAHNIDLAPRLNDLRPGDRIEFKGEYAWNPKGGVVHWTHHDPSGRHADGWLKHNNQTVQ